MVERSGMEILEELLEEIKLLHQKVDLLDRNLKEVANSAKVADLLDKASGTGLDAFSRARGTKKPTMQPVSAKDEIKRIKDKAMRFRFESMDASKVKQSTALASKKARATMTMGPRSIMVKGKMIMMNGDKPMPLSQIEVTIYDIKDKVVKETKTNRAGHWMSQLPPGKYVAKFEGDYDGKKLVPINKSFEVPKELPPGQKEILSLAH